MIAFAAPRIKRPHTPSSLKEQTDRSPKSEYTPGGASLSYISGSEIGLEVVIGDGAKSYSEVGKNSLNDFRVSETLSSYSSNFQSII